MGNNRKKSNPSPKKYPPIDPPNSKKRSNPDSSPDKMSLAPASKKVLQNYVDPLSQQSFSLLSNAKKNSDPPPEPSNSKDTAPPSLPGGSKDSDFPLLEPQGQKPSKGGNYLSYNKKGNNFTPPLVSDPPTSDDEMDEEGDLNDLTSLGHMKDGRDTGTLAPTHPSHPHEVPNTPPPLMSLEAARDDAFIELCRQGTNLADLVEKKDFGLEDPKDSFSFIKNAFKDMVMLFNESIRLQASVRVEVIAIAKQHSEGKKQDIRKKGVAEAQTSRGCVFEKADLSLSLWKIPVDVDSKGVINRGTLKDKVIDAHPLLSSVMLNDCTFAPLARKPDDESKVSVLIECPSKARRDTVNEVLRSSGVRTSFNYPQETYKILRELRTQLKGTLPNQQVMIRPTRDYKKLLIKSRPDINTPWSLLDTVEMPLSRSEMNFHKLKSNPCKTLKRAEGKNRLLFDLSPPFLPN